MNEHQTQSSDGVAIAQTISACWADSVDQSHFLKLVAAELLVAFDAGLVAVDFADGTPPAMLVADELLSVQIDRDAIRNQLSEATETPTAAEIPLANATTFEPQSTRGLRVRIPSLPHQTAVLLVYRGDASVEADQQLSDLKQLREYVDAMTQAMGLRSTPARASSRTDQQTASRTDQAHTGTLAASLRSRQPLQLFHQDLDLDATAYRVANESRRVIGCDRATVLLRHRNRYRVQAISGVAVVDTRSNSVRSVEELAATVAIMSAPLVVPSEDVLPPQISESLDAYLDETQVTSAMLIPLHGVSVDSDPTETAAMDALKDSGDIVGVLVLEYFEGQPPKSLDSVIRTVCTEAVLALQNALHHQSIFGLRFWKFLGGCATAIRRPLVASAMLAAIGLLIASMLIHVEHYVVATGTTQPAKQRHVFAGVDGVVKQIHVQDGQKIQTGDPVLDMENAELDRQAESIAGEIVTTSQRLASIQALRLSGQEDETQAGRLVMELRQLKSTLENLRAQQTLIQQQQNDLKVTSPIDGTVIAWQVQQRLDQRPVAKGNLLLSVADQSSPWLLRLTIADRDIGPVLESIEQSQRVPVQFAVATLPNATYSAHLDSVATATRVDESGQHVVDLIATVIDSESDDAVQGVSVFARQDARSGADVTAKIMCGRRTILRSWFSDVFDFVDRNIMFYFR